jgi:dsRNA-specific ribonuclease
MHKINHKAVEYRVHQDKTSHEFTAEIWCNGIKYAIGKGMNIRDAEFKAAKTVYSKLSKVK